MTTLLLPIDRFAIVIAKFLTVAVICVAGAAFNLVCLGLFVIFLIASILGHAVSLGQIYYDFQHPTAIVASQYLGSAFVIVQRFRQYVQIPTLAEILLMVAFFCSTGALLSAVYLCIAGYGKTVKSAQTLVSLPMILLMTLPDNCNDSRYPIQRENSFHSDCQSFDHAKVRQSANLISLDCDY